MPVRSPCWEVSISLARSSVSVTVRIPESCQSLQTFIQRQPDTLSLQVPSQFEGRPGERILENSLEGGTWGVLLGWANRGWVQSKGQQLACGKTNVSGLAVMLWLLLHACKGVESAISRT